MVYVKYVLARVGSAAITLFGVSLLVFLAIHLIPGRFVDIAGGLSASPELKAAISARLGLDKPLILQYVNWVLSAVHGDFGDSLITSRPISDELVRRAPVTAQLALSAVALSLLIGVPLGIAAGLAGKPIRDRGFVARHLEGRSIARLVGSAGLSVPDFVLGSIFVYVFSAHSWGLTVGGYVPFTDDPVANLRAMLLPVVTLSVFGTALTLRTTRDAVRTVLTEPYITAAVARGEPPAAIVRRHVIRNAAIPVLTVAGTTVGYLLGGAVIVEVLFSIPGLGHYVYESINVRDYPVVQDAVMLAAFVFITINMLSDIAYVFLDPRIGSRRASQ